MNTNTNPALLSNLGLLTDIEEKLGGANHPYWRIVYSRVSRGENPFEIPKDLASRWKMFYLKLFGQEHDFSGIHIPQTDREDFNEVMIIPQGITLTEVVSAYRKNAYLESELFGTTSRERVSLHATLPHTEEDVISYERSKDTTYALRLCDTLWQDELEGCTYSSLQEKSVSIIDPLEYLVYDLYHMWSSSTGVFAMQNASYCSVICCGAMKSSDEESFSYPTLHWDYHGDAYFHWDGRGCTKDQLKKFTLKKGDPSRSGQRTIAIEVLA